MFFRFHILFSLKDKKSKIFQTTAYTNLSRTEATQHFLLPIPNINCEKHEEKTTYLLYDIVADISYIAL